MQTETETEIEKQAREEKERHAAIDAAVEGWTPMGDHLILASIRATEKRVGSIVVPGADSPMGNKIDRRGRLARVVACGPEAKEVAVNMRVFAPTYAGAVIDLEGQVLIVIRESELLLTADVPAA